MISPVYLSPDTGHKPAGHPLLRTVTLGCKVNQYETEFLRQALTGIGYRDAADDERADLCLVNTCTVTQQGDSKSRQAIRQLAARNPDARIVVMGCYATRAPDEVARLPGVAEIVTDKRELPDLLGRFGVVDLPTGINTFANRQRAYVKVQDGCVLHCSFCIIPKVRPYLASRPVQHILNEVEQLVAGGYRELILTGIHLGHYGIEWNRGRPKQDWIRLANLVEKIAALSGDFRIRLSSIEATEVTRELIAAMAKNPDKVCPHLHISMQSGSDAVLRRMRRRWGAKRIIDRCRLVQQTLDQPALTTDIIVGFPGEADEDFTATCEVVRELGFSKIHIFPYSRRRGTPAAELPDQVPPDVKSVRVELLTALEAEMRDRYYRSLCGRRLRVLIESPIENQPGQMLATACRYAPVEVPGNITMRKQFVEVVARGLVNGRIQGT
ncbi:MAG: tRNA (N(6)-L-threonylcarbamoyladenosine(37)-C(2))-methylthiotransferase MtaB [Pirellulales bacterium]|nr:tRNA (N(6)-L-threonylcarbamoyladenosine(37)-C(2))-methylthiotransferase MtaB [Pirellulales bacterium]